MTVDLKKLCTYLVVVKERYLFVSSTCKYVLGITLLGNRIRKWQREKGIQTHLEVNETENISESVKIFYLENKHSVLNDSLEEHLILLILLILKHFQKAWTFAHFTLSHIPLTFHTATFHTASTNHHSPNR